MNYIVLDLEWNQSSQGKEELKEIPFEIVEIGADKLDENFQTLDRFHALIYPVVYREMNVHTKEVVRLSMNELKNGRAFKEVCEEFLDWCGQEIIFCTWGSMDLTELQRNMAYFEVKHIFPFPFFYYDVQKLYSICYGDGKERLSLEHAVEELNLQKERPFHRADADTWYTAEILKRLDIEMVGQYKSIDYYHLPQTHKQEIHIDYETYSKYVSRGFQTKEQLMEDREVNATRCYLCHKNIKRKVRWFSYNNRIYYSLMYCDVHGWVKGKIRIKRGEHGEYFAVKTIKITDENGAMHISKKKEEAKLRKKLKRDRMNI